MKVKEDKLTKEFMKLMADMGATFIDVTPKKKKPKKNYLPKIKK
ncbi:MAG: hypothetical protein Q7R97_04240 [Candidatus Daviesbacteria bacterium]|nr:hypothetical protein [Candidatus Daviesbacteria bacterium]